MKRYVVGYGSLMSHRSLSKTIPDKHFTPVLIRGYKRIFNLMGLPKRNPDVLNAQKARGHTLNGVMFAVNEKELQRIMEREEDYNLEETHAYDFLTHKKLGKCYICADYIVGIDAHQRLPDRKYFIQCREAAYHISEDFGTYWDETTYLANGQKVKNWLKTNKSWDTLARKQGRH